MAILDYINVYGFKSIAQIERLELRQINLVIGANGTGKSNFIGIFSFLYAIRSGHLQEYVTKSGGADKLLHFGSRTTEGIQLLISFNDERNQYLINLERTDFDRLVPSVERVYFWDKRHPSPYSDRLVSPPDEAAISFMQPGIASFVQGNIDSWRVYHFHDTSATSPMKKTADVNDNRYLRPEAANLAAFLYLLKVRYEAEYTLIKRSFQLVAPFFDDFILEPLALNPETIRLEWKHTCSDGYFDASSLSDGSLRFLALATLLLQPTELRPSVILIDEPELGLHPYAITLLASLIKQASAETQVIVSTQSASLLDHFEPEDVLVADLVDGATQLTRLSSEGLEAWLENYSLGQLWEKNEIGGRPGGR